MEKIIKRIAMLFMVCGFVVSISMGAYIPKSDEENYQKLKAEMEEVEQSEYWKSDDHQVTCSWGEDGKVVINRGNESYLYGTRGESWCGLKNVLAFFDEIRVLEVKTKNRLDSPFSIAIAKVREMPRFKEDSGIYLRTRKISVNEAILGNSFWHSVFEVWKELKMQKNNRKI